MDQIEHELDPNHVWIYDRMGKYRCAKCNHLKKSRLTPTPDVLIFKMINNRPYKMTCYEVRAMGVLKE